MPKMKTNRGAAKRFKLSANGRVRFRRARRNHILTKKPEKTQRQNRKLGVLAKADENSVRRMLNEE